MLLSGNIEPVNFEKKIAITLSYAGGNKNLPGHYGEYHLDNIYSIFRPKK